MSDEMQSVGELAPDLLAEVKAIKRRRSKGELTQAQEKDIRARIDFEQQEYGTETLAYMPSQLVQCTFPHDDPGEVPTWSRSTPWLTVTFQPGYKTDRKTRQQVCIGYPYGTIPRLLMFYVMAQIQHVKNRDDLTPEEKRTVMLGASLSDFMRNIGLNPDNGTGKRSDKRRLRSQVERFMRVRVNMEAQHDNNEDGYAFSDMLIAEDGEFWWTSHDDDQPDLFTSYIVLSEKFYRRVLKNLVPLDMAALKALKNSALHLDLYAWCLYRGHTLSKGKKEPQRVEWRSFMMQSGSSYKHVRQFRSRVIAELGQVTPYLKHMRVQADDKGITVYPTRLSIIPPRSL